MRKKSFLQCETHLFIIEGIFIALLCVLIQVPALLLKWEEYNRFFFVMLELLLSVFLHSLFIISVVKVINAFVEKRSTACILTFILYGFIDISSMVLVSMGVLHESVQLSLFFVLPAALENWWIIAAMQILLTLFLSLSALKYRCEHMGYMPGDGNDET